MIFHLFLLPFVVVVVLFAIVIRVLTAPFGMGRWHRRRYGFGYGRGWGGGYGCRHPYGGGGLLTILALVALERLFGRRY